MRNRGRLKSKASATAFHGRGLMPLDSFVGRLGRGRVTRASCLSRTEAIYGGSRYEARGKTYAGYSDGSYGSSGGKMA